MGSVSDDRIWSEGPATAARIAKGTVASAEPVSVRLIEPTSDGARFGGEVPAALFRLMPRTIHGFSFWRMEVAVGPEQQTRVSPRHALVAVRYPYGSLWCAVARFRTGAADGSVAMPPHVNTLERTQHVVDFELDADPWERGPRLVAGLSLPLNFLGMNAGVTPIGGGYAFGACEDVAAVEDRILTACGVRRLVRWSDFGTFHPTETLDGIDEERAKRDILQTIAIRLALAGPLDATVNEGDDVAGYAERIAGELAAGLDLDLRALANALALSSRSFRKFSVDGPFGGRAAAADRGRTRLVYTCTGPGVLETGQVPMPPPIANGEILTQLRSLTLCCTDVSNLQGVIGHGHQEARILGHENCNLVLESRVDGIAPGDFVVPLGDDWLGLAEYETFRPVLPEHDPKGIDLVYESRGGYFDPDSRQHIKAVCVVKGWRSGISLIEPLTHVYTYFATARDARIARTVVVLGGGACGLFFCLFTRLFGAATRIAIIDIMDERLRIARDLGLADVTLNAATQQADCRALVGDTHGEYADVVFDALPGRLPDDSPPTRQIGMQMLRPRGEYILYAAAETTAMPSIEMLAKGPRFHFAPYDSRIIDFTQRAQFMRKILAMIEGGQIRPEQFISRQIDFRSTGDVRQLFREYGRTAEIKVEVLAVR